MIETPTLITDSREQRPLEFRHFPSERGTLAAGDYSVRGFEDAFAVERKNLADLIGSLTGERDRFLRELVRLRGYRFAALLIEGRPEDVGAWPQRNRTARPLTPASVFGSLLAIEARFRLLVVWAGTREAAALRIERWAWHFWSAQVRALGMRVPPIPEGLIVRNVREAETCS